MSASYDGIMAGQMGAIARALTWVENQTPGYLDLLDRLYQLPKHSLIIGITGAPGSGKSTFINQLVRHGLESQGKIAVIAIDPSSRFSGGALLGDRVRFADNLPFDKVFFRSAASRGAQGGVAPALFSMLQILNAARFDWIIVESVGVGQNELELQNYVDMVLLLLVAGMGDEVQCMKAGIMEIADLFVINKADIYPPQQLSLALTAWLPHDKSDLPVLHSDALHDTGFSQIVQTIQTLQSQRCYQTRNLAKDTALVLSSEGERCFARELQMQLTKAIGMGHSPYRTVSKFQEQLARLFENWSGNGGDAMMT